MLLSSEPVDYTLAFANGLAPHADVSVILPRARYDKLTEWLDPRLSVDLVDWPRTRSWRNPLFLYDLSQRIGGMAPDVLHTLSNTSLWLNAAIPFWRDVPLITTVHDVALHPGDRDTARLPGWSSRLMARQSDDIVVHGEGLRSAAMQTFGKTEQRVHVLQHPAITRYAAQARQLQLARSEPAGSFRVLLFGRIFAYKGLGILIQAEALLRDRVPDLRITIAGRGDDPRALTHLMGCPDRYDLRTGYIEDDEVAQLFTDADLVVLPYDEASQSGVLHVAAAFGKPLLVTDVGELRATVEPNKLGVVVPPRSPDALADAICNLAEDREKLAGFGQQAKAWSDGPNAPETVGRSAMELYRAVTKRRIPD